MIDRVLRSHTQFFANIMSLKGNFLYSRPLFGVILHASAVSWSKFRILTRGYRVGSSNCGLNNVPLISEYAQSECVTLQIVNLSAYTHQLTIRPRRSIVSRVRLFSCMHLRYCALFFPSLRTFCELFFGAFCGDDAKAI